MARGRFLNDLVCVRASDGAFTGYVMVLDVSCDVSNLIIGETLIDFVLDPRVAIPAMGCALLTRCFLKKGVICFTISQNTFFFGVRVNGVDGTFRGDPCKGDGISWCSSTRNGTVKGVLPWFSWAQL